MYHYHARSIFWFQNARVWVVWGVLLQVKLWLQKVGNSRYHNKLPSRCPGNTFPRA
jgi:hypothetical protein